MKLYATTTSERATKGQGGNEYLNIEIKDEKENIFLKLLILPKDNILKYPIIEIQKATFEILEQLETQISESNLEIKEKGKS